jgi:hypothetical protein
MELTPKDLKILTMMNETRLCDKKLFKRDSDEFRKFFSFTDQELVAAVKKLVTLGLLSEMKLGADEVMYFHTEKVSRESLDEDLRSIRR